MQRVKIIKAIIYTLFILILWEICYFAFIWPEISVGTRLLMMILHCPIDILCGSLELFLRGWRV